jgi:hypothetical protein
MRGLRMLYTEIRRLECGGKAQARIPLSRFVMAILALIGLEALLVVWVYELPVRPSSWGRTSGFLRLAEPSILLTHPKGPLCLLLLLVAAAISAVCRDLAELTLNQTKELEQRQFELQESVNRAYVLAGFTGAIALFLKWGG